MATTLNFKKLLDKPEWRPLAVAQGGLTSMTTSTSILLSGGNIASDFRGNNYNTPKLWHLGFGATTHQEYNAVTDAWSGLANLSWGTGGSFPVCTAAAFAPSQGPRGSILAGSTASILNLDTTYYAPVAATWTRAGSVITVTTTRPHNFYAQQRVFVSVSSDATAVPLTTINSSATLIQSVASTTQFTFNGGASGAASGTLTVGIPIVADQWSDRGDGLGFMIRVIGLASGKIEERRIVSNTGYSTPASLYVTAPTIYLDQPLSFTPAVGDTFELLSGTLYVAGVGNGSTGMWRSYDLATLNNADNTYAQSGNRGVANLSLSGNSQAGMIVFDEQHVSADRIPGEGFIVGTSTYDTATLSGTNYINTKNCLLATAIAAGTITGQASNGDSVVVANQYRNFQVRIVEDTVNTTAVGQRRRISSHTAGPSAVYTLSANWTVTPSANCKFVIENWTDNILVAGGNSTSMMTYKTSNLCADTSQTIDTWSTTQFTNTNGPNHSGVLVHCFGAKRSNSANSSVRNSLIFSMVTNVLYTFDIAGGTNGAWTLSTMGRAVGGYFNNSSTTNLISYAYDPHTEEGDAIYLFNASIASPGLSHQIFRINLLKGNVSGYTPIKAPYSVLSAAGTWSLATNPSSNNKMGCICYQDGTTKITAIYAPAFGRPSAPAQNEFFELLISV
jgi:hypothetical protein